MSKQLKEVVNPELAEGYKGLLDSVLGKGTIVYDDGLSEKQRLVFDKFKNGENLCILGSAGVGKSFLIKKMKKWMQSNYPQRQMFVTATTGISAHNIGGLTVHSLLGIGCGDKPVDLMIRKIRSNIGLLTRIIAIDVLVIDEISMMSAILFEKIHMMLSTIRKNKALFGGIQVVLSGDLLQLLPVFRNSFGSGHQDTRLLIESKLFLKTFAGSERTVVLDTNFRQQNDSLFNSALGRLRNGKLSEKDLEMLVSRKKIVPPTTGLVTLVTSNRKADIINKTKMENLGTDISIFPTTFVNSGDPKVCKFLQAELESQFKTRNFFELKLAVGCRVMLLKNLNVEGGLVNGSLGMVTKIIDEYEVMVKFDNGLHETIRQTEWTLEFERSEVCASQIPLSLAYSITVHKSQSLTLEQAVLDLGDCFADHMVYVALSRVKSLEGVFIKSFDEKKVTVNQKMLKFLEKIKGDAVSSKSS
jgi:ATP-dependent DNA helicase PIF1